MWHPGRSALSLFPIAVTWWLVLQSSSPAQPTFRKVADTATSIPAGSNSFTGFIKFGSGAPSIDAGSVAFYGAGFSNQEGVYLETGGTTLTRIVDRNTVYPDGDNVGNYTSINSTLSLSAGRTAFTGSGNVGQTGIFTATAGSRSVLVDTSTAHPNGMGNYSIFGNNVINGTQGIFFGGNNSDTGIYRRAVAGGPITTIAERLDLMPGSATDQFFGFGLGDLENDVVVFAGTGGANLERRGVYRYSAGSLSTLYDTSTPIPGGTGTFANLSGPRLSNGKVVFYGAGDTEQGFYTDASGSLQVVADLTTPVPGGGTFDASGFVSAAIDNGHVAFWSYLASGGNGIYTNLTGALTKVIRTGDTLNGKLVTDLDFSREGLSGNQIAFRAVFSDTTSGIYVANYVVSFLAGDYNNSGKVDAADYVIWRNANGTNASLPNDAVGGTIGTGQYNQWRQNFGKTAPGGTSTAVPEGATLLYLLVAAIGCVLFKSQRRRV
jgi:hypothetical protein